MISDTKQTGATLVMVGATAATSVVVVNATTIAAAAASVVARTLVGAMAGNTRFTYATPAPTVTITLYRLPRYSIGCPVT
jgi:hypothetical protein